MTVEMSQDEATILIAVLVFAEGAALYEAPAITEALKVLRPWRSALLSAYLAERMAQADAVRVGSETS